MKSRTQIIFVCAALCVVVLTKTLRADEMTDIKFDLGANITETAKRSGAPRFATRDVAGLISYEIVNIPENISIRYARRQYEIDATSVFSLTLYADGESGKALPVETAAVQFSTDGMTSHESAQKFVEDLISQFKKGKWSRYIDELCPAVTGRSAFLNDAGEPEQIGTCALDPDYRLKAQDWIQMIRAGQNYKWIGDGVLATLTVGFSEDTRGVSYAIGLEFDDYKMKKGRAESHLARTLAEGDAAGRHSSDKHAKKMQARKMRIRLLEESAEKRGDSVVAR